MANVYDQWYPAPEECTVQLLAELSSKGRALELGIGTGRMAIPLKAAGVDIAGIDVSTGMVDRLHGKAGGKDIPVTIGDFAELKVAGRFDLIFVIFNTFFGLPTQDLQLQCLRSVAAHLTVNGRFLIEAFVPDMTRFVGGQSIRVISVSDKEVRLDVAMHDASSQQIVNQHLALTEKGVQLVPVTIRYAWPSELDMMARLAGLKLLHRYGDWKQSPFTSSSGRHISIYSLGA